MKSKSIARQYTLETSKRTRKSTWILETDLVPPNHHHPEQYLVMSLIFLKENVSLHFSCQWMQVGRGKVNFYFKTDRHCITIQVNYCKFRGKILRKTT